MDGKKSTETTGKMLTTACAYLVSSTLRSEATMEKLCARLSDKEGARI